MRGMGEVRFARQLSREPGIITRTVIKLHDKAQHTDSVPKYSSALNQVASVQKCIHVTKYATRHRKYIQWMQCTNITGSKRLSSWIHSPTQFLRKGLVKRCVCVCVYLHDCTLSKGEVFNKDIKTSVFIIEELPDPPVTHESRERLAGHQIQSTPLSFRTARYRLTERERHKEN